MRLLYASILVYGHLFYQEIELLLRSVFGSRQATIERCEEIFLNSSRKILYFLKITLGVQIEYTLPSQPLPKQAIIISNHQSYCDVLVIRAFLAQQNIRFIAYQRLQRRFLAVSRLMRLQNHAFIERYTDSFSAMRTIRHFAKRLVGTDLSPVIFPEGKFEPDGTLLPFFAAGLRQLSAHLDVPLVLVLIRNCHRLKKASELVRNPLSAPIQIEVIRCIDDPAEKRRCIRQISLIEQEYQNAFEAR